MLRTLSVVMPAYNESSSLSLILPQVLDYCRAHGWEVVIVNDGSTDDTARILEQYTQNSHLRVVTHKVNKGYGGALKSGLGIVRTEFAITMDADGQHSLSDIELVLRAQVDQDADMVVGKRSGRAVTNDPYRRIGKWLIRRIAASLTAVPVRDLNSGFKLYRTAIVQRYLYLCPDSMAFSDVVTLIFSSQRHKVVEYPVHTFDRVGGTSTIRSETAFITVMEILHIIMFFNPMRFFLPLAVGSFVVGILWGIPIVFMGRGVSVGALLAVVMGMFFFSIGLLGEQLSLVRKELLAARDQREPVHR